MFEAVPVIGYSLPTSDVDVAVVVKFNPRSSPSTTVPSVTLLVNSTIASPYTLVLSSIVISTSLAVIVYGRSRGIGICVPACFDKDRRGSGQSDVFYNTSYGDRCLCRL